MKITKSQFLGWKCDIITQEILKDLIDLRKAIEDDMLNANNIFHKNSKQILARLVGYRDGVDVVLNLSVEDFDDDDEEES